MRTETKVALKVSAIFAGVFLVLILAGELICLALGLGQSAYLQPDPDLGFRLIPGKKVEWTYEGYSNDSISGAGFRDVEHSEIKPSGVKRILILGDSFGEALQVPMVEGFSRRLQSKLDSVNGQKYEVINACCSCYSVGQSALMYDCLADVYTPDEIFLIYGIGNSMQNIRHAGDRSVEARPYFYLRNNVLEKDTALLPGEPYCQLAGFLLKHSRLVNYLWYLDFCTMLKDPNYIGVRKTFLSIVRSFHGQKRYPDQARSQVRDAVLSRLNDAVERHGAKLTVFILPSFGEKNLKKDSLEVIELSRKKNFAAVDLEDAFKGRRKKASLEHHMSSFGHEIAANRMYQYVQQKESQNRNHMLAGSDKLTD